MVLRFALILAAAASASGAGWDSVLRLSPGTPARVETRTGKSAQGDLRRATDTAVVLTTKSGEQSFERADVRRVRVANPGRRTRNGLISLAAGAGAGYAIGVAVCPSCQGEGVPAKYTGPLTAVGAAVGALGFLPVPYSTVYDSGKP
ncbi:MAG: hypothetical protein FJW40_01830 [Acidobacteria bacterium]|nr:hypothetical protein [Acidobacteriota bacterium]